MINHGLIVFSQIKIFFPYNLHANIRWEQALTIQSHHLAKLGCHDQENWGFDPAQA